MQFKKSNQISPANWLLFLLELSDKLSGSGKEKYEEILTIQTSDPAVADVHLDCVPTVGNIQIGKKVIICRKR